MPFSIGKKRLFYSWESLAVEPVQLPIVDRARVSICTVKILGFKNSSSVFMWMRLSRVSTIEGCIMTHGHHTTLPLYVTSSSQFVRVNRSMEVPCRCHSKGSWSVTTSVGCNGLDNLVISCNFIFTWYKTGGGIIVGKAWTCWDLVRLASSGTVCFALETILGVLILSIVAGNIKK